MDTTQHTTTHNGDTFSAAEPATEQRASSSDRLDRSIALSGAAIRIDSQQFRGGRLSALVAGIELDLSQAELAPEGAVLSIHAMLGGVDIRVPAHWVVDCEVQPFFAGVEDERHVSQVATDKPRLRIVGSVVAGGVSVRC